MEPQKNTFLNQIDYYGEQEHCAGTDGPEIGLPHLQIPAIFHKAKTGKNNILRMFATNSAKQTYRENPSALFDLLISKY
ncbi:p-hydroxybenzoate hydroxylase transcriptional activator [Frankliniella fusca]|uniref:p-hydroxybenzoate hydroxylase transcriptional activator n=1 Tax=Frankliniella fusca TaxID=407009 RepID=A0AAE1HTQ1_9NEOP|nr:p-hydroxybenzoate hydroxylase transcriptional activator [Frankliniella fusca]